MKVTVIGCGTFDSNRNGNASFLLEEGNRKMLIDCGTKIPAQFDKLGLNFKDIDDIYISHQHADHIGGLEEVAFKRYDWINKPRRWDDWKKGRKRVGEYLTNPPSPMYEKVEGVPYIQYAPRLIADADLMKLLWNESLKGGLGSLQKMKTTLSTFFEPMPIETNEDFTWCGWTVSLMQMVHIMAKSAIKLTFGLIFSKPNHHTIFFTTDSQYCNPDQVVDFYGGVDVIFQDCELAGVVPKDKAMDFKSGVHANYAQLAGWESANSHKLSDDIKGKMWLTHYQDFKMDNKDYKGNTVNWDKQAQEDGFMGFVKVGQEFIFNQLHSV